MPIAQSGQGSNWMRPNVPIAIQVANHLRARLRSEFAGGGRLPSENELAGARFQGAHVARIALKLKG